MINTSAKTTLGSRFRRLWMSLGDDGWRVANIILAATAAFIGLIDLAFDIGVNGAMFTWVSAAVIIVASASLTACRVRPVAVLVLVSLARLVVAADAGTEVALSVPGAVALYAVAHSGTRRHALVAAFASAVVAALAIVIVSPEALIEEISTEVMIVLLVLAVAEVVRTNRARTNERIAAEASERVHAERLRIARDLHDVVAHSLSNIAVQSGVASRLIDDNPEHAKKALEIINDAGRSSLDELRTFLHLLRVQDEAVETNPTPDRPVDIDDLIEQSGRAGITVEVVRNGEFPSTVLPGVVLTTYRIVQESLTNVARHAGAVAVLVEFEHGDDGLHLRVSNEPGRANDERVPSTGVGIIGMKERAEAIGGSLSASSLPSGGFTVRATLPYHQEETDSQ